MWQVLATSRYAHNKNTPLPWGRTRVLLEPFGLDRTRLRQMNKMTRYKQCQKLVGSGNADSTAPQGVTPKLY